MKPRLLFITVDALGPEILARAKAPVIKRIMEEGLSVQKATSHFPTLTTPMMSTILTGCLPDRHGIECNTRLDIGAGRVRGKLRDLKVATIGDILVENGYSVASVQHFMLEGRAGISYTQTDGANTTGMTDLIAGCMEEFDAVFTIFQAVDAAGHRFGPFHERTLAEVEKIDWAIGRLLEVWKGREFLLVISSDHSMSYADRASDFSIEEFFASMNLKAAFIGEGESFSNLDIAMLRYPTVPIFLLSERARNLRVEITDRLRNERELWRVYSKEEMESLGNGRYGDIACTLNKGVTTARALVKMGGFGYHGTEGEEGTVIAFQGSMLKSRRIPAARLADIVPTTLRILSIESERKFDGENIWSCDDGR
ncbi:MAG TPA: alkaline phosphatase family protein [Mesotoga infera]|jgi:arylsulfatase A-like enzyme|nr:alkaline phosphatase family protein [Mesotoga sp.]HNS67458.1 alkaline phosphatase family protein [Mesotoga infera]HOI64315.1 alkaline phosphatase family protein [Mesotoga sp.]HON28013.1 alkaline phosphatase family protein [Mesotoga infera]HPD37971.1 alkaline phosphatase family protein [Mesotoga infera]